MKNFQEYNKETIKIKFNYFRTELNKIGIPNEKN